MALTNRLASEGRSFRHRSRRAHRSDRLRLLRRLHLNRHRWLGWPEGALQLVFATRPHDDDRDQEHRPGDSHAPRLAQGTFAASTAKSTVSGVQGIGNTTSLPFFPNADTAWRSAATVDNANISGGSPTAFEP